MFFSRPLLHASPFVVNHWSPFPLFQNVTLFHFNSFRPVCFDFLRTPDSRYKLKKFLKGFNVLVTSFNFSHLYQRRSIVSLVMARRKNKTGPSKEKEEKQKTESEPKREDVSNSENEESNDVEEKKEESAQKAGGKKRAAKEDKETKEELANKKVKQTENKTPEEVEKPQLKDLNFDCEKKTADGKTWNLKISSWNVAGLKAWVKKGGLDYLKKESPDILCLQETKCSEKKLPPEIKVQGYYTYWVNGVKEGYAGVGLFSKEKPLKVSYGLNDKEHDSEGRVITAEYDKFYLVTTYVPNAGQGLKTLPKRMKWDPDFRKHLTDLDAKKPVILCGDLNVAHNAIDLANPKTNTKSAGFTQEERDGMTELLKQGFVDTFRHLYPEQIGAYTFWTYFSNARARNTGWRLDYFILSERFMPALCDNVIRNKVFGSDHCPITLFLHV